MMAEHLGGDWTKDRRFAYLLMEDGRPVSYVIFLDVRHDPAAILSVLDYAWDGREGFLALLGFLARFSADYGTVEISLPSTVQLASVIHAPDAYDLRQECRQGYMLRAVNVPAALSAMRRETGCAYTVRVEDPLIRENSGVWRVDEGGAARSEGEADLEVSIQALSLLVCGSVSLSEALLREDVRLRGNEETLSRLFRRRPILIAEHY